MPKKKSSNKKVKESRNVEPLKEPRKVKQRKGTKAILVVLVILVVLIAVLILILLFQFGVYENPLDKIGREVQLFNVEDECSMILGNLIHTVVDEGVCEQKCSSQCDVREMEYVSSEFTESILDCHKCDCYCK